MRAHLELALPRLSLTLNDGHWWETINVPVVTQGTISLG